MKKKLFSILFALVLVVSMSLVTAPVSASPGETSAILKTDGDLHTAEWSTDYSYTGDYSAKLTVYEETMNYQFGAQVALDLVPITADQLPPVSFMVYVPTTDDLIKTPPDTIASPYFQFTVDLHGITPEGATHASIVSGDPTMSIPAIGEWTEATLALDGQWLVWSWVGELVASGATLVELHGALVAEYPGYEVTRVSVQHGFRLAEQMTADTATVYVDDITINGVPYGLEPATGEVTMTAASQPAVIGISVAPAFIDFGAVTSGATVPGTQLTISNLGNVCITVDAEITADTCFDAADTFYFYTAALRLQGGPSDQARDGGNLSILGKWIHEWLFGGEPIEVGGSRPVTTSLDCPPEIKAATTYTGTVVFWAEQP